MKRAVAKFSHGMRLVGAACLVVLSATLAGCKENIDDSNFAIKTEQTIWDYISSSPQFSDVKQVYQRVTLGNDSLGSSIASVLSARGNYTIFAPDNDAVEAYMVANGVATLEELTDEQASIIAKNSIIDNGDNSAYTSAEFPADGGGFGFSNLNDRILTSRQDTIGNESFYIINGTSRVVKGDVDLSNGVLHEVSTVIAPAADNLAQRIAAADNMKIFTYLMSLTTWADSLTQYLDMDYEKENYQEITDYRLSSETGHVIRRNTHRYIGYMAFVEPDEVYAADWGLDITKAPADLIAEITAKCEAVYGTAAQGDYTSPDNAVNRFVAYHLMYGSRPYNGLVRHLNEYNYKYKDIKNPQLVDCPTNVWDYYTTMGKYPSLVKVTQLGDAGTGTGEGCSPEDYKDHKMYVNRISIYANGRHDDYHETGVRAPGILLNSSNGDNDNSAQNGFYFPIAKVLLNDEATRRLMGQERMRIDVVSMLPEIASNNNRGGDYRLYPLGYFDNIINESTDTKIVYVCDQYGGGWNDYQGDEFLFCGLYDFTLKLPPVPWKGTYEIRMGVGMNSLRGMAQIYFGEDPHRLSPVGLPYDMRQTVDKNNTEIPWEADVDDDETNAENDKNMRNHGYLKGPNYFTITDGKATTPVRQRSGGVACVRRIITIADMEPGKTYYLRFKSALKKLDSQFFLDYFEFVPNNIYNGTTPEDIW